MKISGKKEAVSFENFTFQYESQSEPTLYDINLKIYEGEKVLIIGPSGSGKVHWGIVLTAWLLTFTKVKQKEKLKFIIKRLKGFSGIPSMWVLFFRIRMLSL